MHNITRVAAEDLGTIDLRNFHVICATYRGQSLNPDNGVLECVEIKKDHRLGLVYGPQAPAKETVTNELMIEVDNPDDVEAINRIRAQINQVLGIST